MFSFTGSAKVSTCATVTGRSRNPLSATINPVKSFVVPAGARLWSGFFSYNTCPLLALITMTEVALVRGTEPGTLWVGIGSSAESRSFAARRARRGRGVALSAVSESESGVAADFFLWWRCGTPDGRTSFGFSSGETVVGSTPTQMLTMPIAQKKDTARNQRFMGG